MCNFRSPDLRSVRRWPVKKLDHWLIFYQPTPDGVEIIHLVHKARDIESLLDG